MAKLTITEDDINWLRANYPDLYFDPNESKIRGELFFKMYYSKSEKARYVINPDSSYEGKDGIFIQDAYEIEIYLSGPGFLPEVREVGGRILNSKAKWNIAELADLHLYQNGSACLCIKTEEQTKMPNGFNLKDFFENLLIPFFYYQSFFEKYGREPWKGYSHGDLGFLESYFCQKNPSPEMIGLYFYYLSDGLKKYLTNNVRFRGHEPCICQSKRKFRKCHRDAFLGYNKLRVDFMRLV